MSNVVALFNNELEEATGEVCFVNDGEIDVNTIRMMGVSVKDENAIGFFGTGLKYAIAVLLRHNLSLVIYSGELRLEFAAQNITVRGKEFKAVMLNGEQLGFTTELGKTWELWQAYRELYCNCIDEGGEVEANVFEQAPESGKTKIYVSGLSEIYQSRSEYFLESKPIARASGFELHAMTGNGGIYYKGVKVCGNQGRLMSFNYNITSKVDLTEDRTLKYISYEMNQIVTSVVLSDDKKLITSIIKCPAGGFEDYYFDFHDTSLKPSEAFLDAVDKAGQKDVLPKAYELMKRHALRRGIGISQPLSNIQQKQMARALTFLAHLGFDAQFPIIVTDALSHNVLGMAEDDKIYISFRCFSMGTKQLVMTIYEEFIHLKHGVNDESRAMQDVLFEKIITMLEEKLDEAI